MVLDNFILEEYSDKSIDHKSVVIELMNDTQGKNYLGDLMYSIDDNREKYEKDKISKSYIAYYNGNAVGYISLYLVSDKYHISYGIVPKYRGMHLGALLLHEFTLKSFELYPIIEQIILIISCLNTGSKKTALLAGYKKENSVRYTMNRVGE